MDIICPVCSHGELESVRTYKHLWLTCQRCRNTTRQRRERYPAQRVLPVTIGQRALPGALPGALERMLYPGPAVTDTDERFYDYYATAAQHAPAKWGAQIDKITARLLRHDAQLDGAVLDVSGGPGFLTQHIAKTAEHAVVTEFSDTAVTGMREHLAVDAIKFDYNTDAISAVTPGPFDTVIIDYSLNFCVDVARFATDLARACRPGALVYVSFVLPTLGCALRWQYDDYTYNVLYQPQTVTQAFADAGFKLAASEWDATYRYTDGMGWKMRLLRAPLDALYWLRASRTVDRSLQQVAAVHYYRSGA